MDAIRAFLVVVVCLGAAGPVAQAQDRAVAAESARVKGPVNPWTQVRGFGRVLDLSNPPVVIDEPGLYAIDKDWSIPRATTEVVPELIQITADNVTLDLHDYEIVIETAFTSATLLVISGGDAEVRNGTLAACCEAATAIRGTRAPRLHHVSISSWENVTFVAGVSITDSRVAPRFEMRFEGRADLERNSIECNRGFYCIRLLGDENRFVDNKMRTSQGGGLEVVGNGGLVANTVMDRTDQVDYFPAFDIKGDHNLVRGNTVILGGAEAGQPLFAISGTGNTLDANIVPPPAPGQRALIGMQFTADGNFYGDNRMAAQVPFALGGTVQTDWGGNVGY